MFKKMLIFSAMLSLSLSFLVGCNSDDDSQAEDELVEEEIAEEELPTPSFSDILTELTVENVIVEHREDIEVRDRGEHGVDMMFDDQIFVNINPTSLELDEFTLENAEEIAQGMSLVNSTELERQTINNNDAFSTQGFMEEMPEFLISVVFFLANDYLYSMSYIAPEETFELYYPYFAEIRDSIQEIEIEELTPEEVQAMVIDLLNEMDSEEYIDFGYHTPSAGHSGNVSTINQPGLANVLGLEEGFEIGIFTVTYIERVNQENEEVDPESEEVNESNFVEWDFDYEVNDEDEMTITFTVIYDIEIEEEEPLEPVTLFTGDWEGGSDVPVGRWVITGSGSGNFTIHHNSRLHVNEILGSGDFGVTSITTDISEGDEIGISGLNEVIFTPVTQRTTSDVLTTGHWVVGEDIEAGSFDATTPSGSGNFVIHRGNRLVTNEILGDGGFGVERVRVNLTDGDRISISGIERVYFEES